MKRTISALAAAVTLTVSSQIALAASAVEEAQAMVNQGQLEAALKRLDAQLRTAPQDAEARFMRGLVLTRMKRTEEAIKAFSDITRDYPQLPEPYNNLAVLYAQRGDYEKARDALEAALATHPSYATAHENLGDIYAALAGAAYNRALMLDQSNQAVRNKLSFVNQLGHTGTAKPAFPASSPVPPPAPVRPSVVSPAPPLPPASGATLPPRPAEPTVVATPTRPPVVAPPSVSNSVESAVNAWKKAWESQDVEGYLGSYSTRFTPEGGLTRATWESRRRSRVSRPSDIDISVSNIRVTPLDGGNVRVTFRQRYSSNSFSDTVTKVLEMTDESGWKITREYTR